MFNKEITFDRFIRGSIAFILIICACLLLKYLSVVLIPFFVAWLLAYLLYPIVNFLQHRCHLRYRIISILLTLALVGGSIGGIMYLTLPTMAEEAVHLKDVAVEYIEQGRSKASVPSAVLQFVREHANQDEINKLLHEENVVMAVKRMAPQVWEMLWSTAGVLLNIVASLIGLLYLFFLLMDYEKYTKKWIEFVPQSHRDIVQKVITDVEHGMSRYFRGQALIALSNCVMFTIGFFLIGFPMPMGLGCFIGIISFVPYLQLIGFLPATFLALLHAAETGDNFWLLMGGVVLVYSVVQIIQDAIVTPKVMGKIMGLSPAIVLLALSVWGYMFGIIGLIIALPATTLISSYYKNFIATATTKGTP